MGPPFSSAFLLPVLAAMSAGEATAAFLRELAASSGTARRPMPALPDWASPNRVTLDLPSLRLRDFSQGASGRPTVICAPYALHAGTVADFAPGHSLVESLRGAGRENLHVVEWRSATPSMRLFSTDTLLADLNVAIDEFGEPVDLVGLCQGGWMALLYAARFPEKVRRLVIAGAPLDLTAGESALSQVARRTPVSTFVELLRLGGGRLLGQMVLGLWGPAPTPAEALERDLQLPPGDDPIPLAPEAEPLLRRFQDWYDVTVDLPGVYYLEVVEWLYKENRLAESRFVALGRRIDLAAVRLPVLLLAGADDTVVVPAQVFAIAGKLGTPPEERATLVAPASHLGLFMGRRSLAETWPRVAAWLDRPETPETAPAP